MSIEENKAVVRRFYEEWNKQNLSIVEELVAPHWVCHGAPPFSPDPKQMLTALWTAFPDARIAVEDLMAEGDKVVSRLTMRGTHRGDLMGIPPTGQQASLTGIEIDRIEDGKIVETWVSRDDLGFLQQLGVIPQMAQTGA